MTTITIKLKEGTVFERKPITPEPFGEHETMVSFWLDETTIRAYPLADVEYVDVHVPEGER